jgi:biopolymer transport protein ExbD
MKQLPSYLDKSEDVRQSVKGVSIPMDSVNKELTSWVKYSLQANPEAKLAIRGDSKAQYPQFKALFDGLKDIEFYKFVLITSSE